MTPKQRFVHLTEYFLNSTNPLPDNLIVGLDCLLAVPEQYILDLQSLRYFAHEFADQIRTMLNGGDAYPTFKQVPYADQLNVWMFEWFKNYSIIEFTHTFYPVDGLSVVNKPLTARLHFVSNADKRDV